MTKNKTRKINNTNSNNRINGEYFLVNDIKPQTKNQSLYMRSILESVVTICHGPAGTGKTFCAVGLSCQKLVFGQIKQVLISRSIVECGRPLGALPGGLTEKIHPYMLPVVEYFEFFLGKKTTERLVNEEIIKLMPVEMLRGHNLEDAYCILEETQNCTPKQIKLFMSRIGQNSKLILVGDNRQSDSKENGLDFLLKNFRPNDKLSIVELQKQDILRNPIIGDILDIFEKHNI